MCTQGERHPALSEGQSALKLVLRGSPAADIWFISHYFKSTLNVRFQGKVSMVTVIPCHHLSVNWLINQRVGHSLVP